LQPSSFEKEKIATLKLAPLQQTFLVRKEFWLQGREENILEDQKLMRKRLSMHCILSIKGGVERMLPRRLVFLA
jgi:hypothetical protein